MPPPPPSTPHAAPCAVECRDCGLVQRLPELPHHTKARCVRCEAVLRRRFADPARRALALGMAGAALMVPVLLTPLMDFNFRGQVRVASVFTGPTVLGQEGMAPVGILVLAVVVVVPALRLAALLAVLLGLRMHRPPPALAALFRFYRAAARWSMIEVFLLGTFVAYNRLAQMATIDLGPAMTALALLMLASVAIDAALDPDAIWDAIGRHGRHWRPSPRPAAPGTALGRAGQIVGCPHCRLLVRIGRGRAGAGLPALRGRAVAAQARQPRAHLGASDRGGNPLYSGQYLSGDDHRLVRPRLPIDHPGRRGRTRRRRACGRSRCWCSSPASPCRC